MWIGSGTGERGTKGKQILDVINSGFPVPAKYGREGKAKTYGLERKQLDKYCQQERSSHVKPSLETALC